MKHYLLIILAAISSMAINGCSDNSTDPANTAPNIVISKIDLIKDDNMNGKVNPGETAIFVVRLKNTGRQTLKNAKVTKLDLLEGHDIDNADVTKYNFGDLAPGVESAPILDTNKYTFFVSIKPTAVPGDLYRFIVLIQGDDYRKWEDTISFTIEKSEANMKVSKIEIIKDPNENGKANPGESLGMKAYIKNVGSSGGKIYLRKIEQIKSGGVLKPLTLFHEPQIYIPAGEESKDGYYFDIDIEESVLHNSSLIYRMELANDVGDSWYDTVAVQVEKSDVDIKLTKVEIINNDKQRLRRSDWGQIKLCLKNLGKDIASHVTIENVTTSPQVLASGFHYERYGNIKPGQETCEPIDQNFAFQIFIDFDDPVKDKLKVNMVLKDGEGNRWKESFELEVEQ